MSRVHATCVAIGGRGILIAGAPGSGKSDLALRLIDRGAVLVSDDYTELTAARDGLIATAPTTIAGQIEVRGLGIIAVATVPSAPVALRIEAGVPERMPHPESWAISGVMIPAMRLNLLEPSAPLKVELALTALRERHG